jgi:DNA polymerase III subunit beta
MVTVDQVTRPGTVAVSASILEAILATVEGSNVSFEAQGRFCELRTDDAQYTLVVQDVSTDTFTPPQEASTFTIERAVLEKMVARSVIAVGKDVGRYAVNGLLLEVQDDTLTIVATDSRRLVRTQARVQSAKDKQPRNRAVIPTKALQEMLRATPDNAPVEIGLGSEYCALRSTGIEVSTRVILGDFPDHTRIIPRDLPNSFVVSRESFQAAIRKAAVFASDPIRSIRIELSDGMLTLKAESEGKGRTRTCIETTGDRTLSLEMDLNPDYLLDYLKSVDGESIRVEYRDSESAVLLGEAGSNDVYLVMPITAN